MLKGERCYIRIQEESLRSVKSWLERELGERGRQFISPIGREDNHKAQLLLPVQVLRASAYSKHHDL